MPELPEVEVTLRGIIPALEGACLQQVVVRNSNLRTKVSSIFSSIPPQKIISYTRRGKYILIELELGTILLHLGMTGHLQIVKVNAHIAPTKHDHIDLVLNNGLLIRFNDQRRFGLCEWYEKPLSPYDCKWLKDLGPEPLSDDFTGLVLYNSIRKRTAPVKEVLMNSHIVVGVGNIYASEVLFQARINPFTPAKQLTLEYCEVLVTIIKDTLTKSIACGGTTIRDFSGADGKLGYFVLNLKVYGHANEPCPICGNPIEQTVLGGRSTYFCSQCQHVPDTVLKEGKNK